MHVVYLIITDFQSLDGKIQNYHPPKPFGHFNFQITIW